MTTEHLDHRQCFCHSGTQRARTGPWAVSFS
uniref:Uncharacterized protein n=1 Tax=Rhizophora mucronata TaxID=61149 RepID=A0A2P2ITM2_RHIMU